METTFKTKNSWNKRTDEMKKQELLLAKRLAEYRNQTNSSLPLATGSKRKTSLPAGVTEIPLPNSPPPSPVISEVNKLPALIAAGASKKPRSTENDGVNRTELPVSGSRNRAKQVTRNRKLECSLGTNSEIAAIYTNIYPKKSSPENGKSSTSTCDTVYKRLMLQNRVMEKLPPFSAVHAPGGKIESVLETNRRYIKQRIFM